MRADNNRPARMTAFFSATLILLSLLSCASLPEEEESTVETEESFTTEDLLLGGYTEIDPEDSAVTAARKAAVEALEAEGFAREEILLLRAATQVVAGLNVRFLGVVDGRPLEVLVYQGFDDSTEITSLTVE
jgi:hypothetical protein